MRYQVNQKEAMHRIVARQEFGATSLSGKFFKYTPSAGRLGEEYERLVAEFNQSGLTGVYVVFSYLTPIAWYGVNDWYLVKEKFSVTTSKQQSKIRHALGLVSV